jgi:hypothetical protein
LLLLALLVAASPPGAQALERREWERRFRELRDGHAQVQACRTAIDESCSLTLCRSRLAVEAELCRDGWNVPAACERAFATPRGRVSPGLRPGEPQGLDCEPLRRAADEAEERWQEAEQELEREATLHQVPAAWRYPD